MRGFFHPIEFESGKIYVYGSKIGWKSYYEEPEMKFTDQAATVLRLSAAALDSSRRSMLPSTAESPPCLRASLVDAACRSLNEAAEVLASLALDRTRDFMYLPCLTAANASFSAAKYVVARAVRGRFQENR